jgi:hypothetical protein
MPLRLPAYISSRLSLAKQSKSVFLDTYTALVADTFRALSNTAKFNSPAHLDALRLLDVFSPKNPVKPKPGDSIPEGSGAYCQ